MKKIFIVLIMIASIFLITGCSEKNAPEDPMIPVVPEGVTENYFKEVELTDREKTLLRLMDLKGAIFEFQISNAESFSINIYTVHNYEIEESRMAFSPNGVDDFLTGYLLVDVSDKYMPRFKMKVSDNDFASSFSIESYRDFSEKIDFGNSYKYSRAISNLTSNLNDEFFFYSQNYETADSIGFGPGLEDVLKNKDEYGADRIGLVLSASINKWEE